MSSPLSHLAAIRSLARSYAQGRITFAALREAIDSYSASTPRIRVSRGTRGTVIRGSKAAKGLSAAGQHRDPSHAPTTQNPVAPAGHHPWDTALNASSVIDHGGGSMADGSIRTPRPAMCGHCRTRAPIKDCVACAAEREWRASVSSLAQYRDVDSADDSLVASVEGTAFPLPAPEDPSPIDVWREYEAARITEAELLARILAEPEDREFCEHGNLDGCAECEAEAEDYAATIRVAWREHNG